MTDTLDPNRRPSPSHSRPPLGMRKRFTSQTAQRDHRSCADCHKENNTFIYTYVITGKKYCQVRKRIQGVCLQSYYSRISLNFHSIIF